MNKKSKTFCYYEKFKAGLLVFLMILCIVQVGILWSSQSGSFPISFLSAFSSSKISQASIEESKGNYLLPYRVVLSTGFDGDHYIIPNGSLDYATLWNGAKLYLVQALAVKPKQIQPFSEDKWGGLVANRPYTFEFKTQIPVDIIKWVLDLENSAGEGLTSIYKFVICPDDPDNGYSDTLYIRDVKNIYTYEISDFKGNALSKDVFESIYTKQKSNNAKNYQMAIEKFRVEQFTEAPINISQDVFGPFTQKSTEQFADITCIPFAEWDGTLGDPSNYEGISKELFGKSRNDFFPDVDANGSAVFKKLDNVYRLYKNSVLEYRYTGSQGTTEKPRVVDAYKNVIDFIMEHSRESDFMSGISIYLKAIEENQENPGSYIFKFDYSISVGGENGEIPILLKNYKVPNSDKQIDASISIEASSKRVIRCEWVALKYEVDKSPESGEWSFVSMQPKVYEAYAELGQKKPSAKDFGIYYVLSDNQAYEKLIVPSFVLFTKDGNFDIPMKGNSK